jgi:hypothetical protein
LTVDERIITVLRGRVAPPNNNNRGGRRCQPAVTG